jgi:transcriptional regulator GlxA family with amidase domain
MFRILMIVTPHFNIAATMAFIDPFRAVNYLGGLSRFRWTIASAASTCRASNGASIDTELLDAVQGEAFDIVVMSSSWAPEQAATPQLKALLRRWARKGSVIAAIDTGAFILADAGLLSGHRTTVHYEHIDAFKELHADIDVTEEIFVPDGKRLTCAGGIAAVDMALQIVASTSGDAMANAAARYIFHPNMRPPTTRQNPADREPLGLTVPETVRRAVALMELHLENVLSITELSARLGLSHRQLDRLFVRYTSQSPIMYYRNIRLDRARGLVTQTSLLILEIALASGFASPVHFSRAYKDRFGLTPRQDRIAGRIPFEFRAWPMHRPERSE